ncbi:MAG: hypothetical protein NTX50_15045 [Candidatus Sumerlaeota bacterium]|nr:hypothetical protein [Candidatus Sumerlaeota bacterium]
MASPQTTEAKPASAAPAPAGAKARPAAAPAPAMDKAGKPLKDPRTPAQVKADDAAIEARKMLDLWIQYKAFLVNAFNVRYAFTEADEQKFLEIAAELQKKLRSMLTIVPKDINFGHDKMVKVLKAAISMSHVRELPEPDKMKIFNEWHSIYILLILTAGAMKFIAEGYVHHVRMKREMDIRGIKKALGQEEAVPFHKNPSAMTMAIVGVFVAAFLLYYLGVIKF